MYMRTTNDTDADSLKLQRDKLKQYQKKVGPFLRRLKNIID